MYKKVKEEMKDIIAIVNECPDSLKEKCFEILLSNLLREVPAEGVKKSFAKPESDDKKDNGSLTDLKEDEKEKEKEAPEEEEISKGDLHMKTRRFLESEGVSYETLNKLYYKDNGKILPLYDDLGSNKIAESQIRITLMMAFENSFEHGEFEVNGENVKKKCQDMKCYDVGNFAKNLKNNKAFFDAFESYDKATPIKISTDGKKELAKLLKSLAK